MSKVKKEHSLRTLILYCEGGNGTTGSSRYVREIYTGMQKEKAKQNGMKVDLVVRWFHNMLYLEYSGIYYRSNPLPGNIQVILRKRGVSDDRIYGTADVIHEPRYLRVIY